MREALDARAPQAFRHAPIAGAHPRADPADRGAGDDRRLQRGWGDPGPDGRGDGSPNHCCHRGPYHPPTAAPTASPTAAPTPVPTAPATAGPTVAPTHSPSGAPTPVSTAAATPSPRPTSAAKLESLIAPGAKIETIATGAGFAEGPLWLPDGRLIVSDVLGNGLLVFDATGKKADLRRPSNRANGHSFGVDGSVVQAESGDGATPGRITRLATSGSDPVLVDNFQGKRSTARMT